MSLSLSQARQIAARYVEAFFALAIKAKAEEQVATDLLSLKSAMQQSEELRKAIANPMVADAEKKAVFAELLKRAEASKVTADYIAFLADKQRLDVLVPLADLFAAKLSAYKGELTAEVTTAKKLKAEQKKAIEKALKETAGKPVVVSVKEDKSILGGMIIRMGSTMLDHSVAGKLQRLNTALKQPTMAS